MSIINFMHLLRRSVVCSWVLGMAFFTTFASAQDASGTQSLADPGRVLFEINSEPYTLSDIQAFITSQDMQDQVDLSDEDTLKNLIDYYVSYLLLMSAGEKMELENSDDFKAKMKLLRDNTLVEMAFNTLIDEKLTDDKLRSKYKEMQEAFEPEREIRVRHILVDDETDAKNIYDELANGVDFASLAKEHSTDPGSRDSGGDIGFISPGLVVPEFSEEAFGLKMNEISSPVKSDFGWHVIQLLEERYSRFPDYEELEDNLRQEVVGEVTTHVMDTLRSESNVLIK